MTDTTALHTELLAHFKRDVDLATAMGVKYTCARQWRVRGRVPPRFWPKFIAALKSGFDVVVTADELSAGYTAAITAVNRQQNAA